VTVADAARKILAAEFREHHWAFDWSAIPHDDVCELLYHQGDRDFMSSGTTGKPKAIRRSAKQLIQELDATLALLSHRYDSIHVTVSPGSLYGYVGTFIGARLGLPTTCDEWGAAGRPITGVHPLVFTVAASWRRLRPAVESAQCNFLTVVHAGSILPPVALATVGERAVQGRAEVLDLFGTTETGVIGSRQALPERKTVWTLCADTTLTFPQLDDHGEARPTVTSPRTIGTASPGAFPSIRLDDWLVPIGDRAFGFRGRRERLVKPGGRCVDLDRLEAQIMSVVPQFDIACLPRLDPDFGEHVEVLVAGHAAAADETMISLRSAPPESLSLLPKWVTPVDYIPKSAMGKVRRVLPRSNEASSA
jgi:acyl-coenzyme A synthetase/AMP-(fatty) acid ligase